MKVHLFAISLAIWYLGTLAFATAPSITSFTPTCGAVGQKVTLHGGIFTTVTGVQFNGKAATYTVVSAAYIIAVVPGGAISGPITVSTSGGMASSAKYFTVNAPPTITTIANQSINMNASTSALAFTVGDDLTAASLLTVTGVSSNKTLLPPIWLVFGGSGATRTVTVKPGVGQSGMATITLTVQDAGGLTAITSFSVTVNAPPTITTIANQLINMGTATSALAFTVGDDLTLAGALTVSVASSNISLVKSAGLVQSGPDSDGHCSVIVTPVSTYSGMTTITLTVTDGGGLTAKTGFTLTVNRPTITSIPNQTIVPGTATAALAFTVGDKITPVSALTVTGTSNNYMLVPNANIVFGGAGSSRTVKITSLNGKTGIATVTLTVKDGAGLTATTSLIVLVFAVISGTNSSDGAALVWVPGGSFTMGCPMAIDGGDASGGETQHVTLSGYWIYKYQVTVAQYRAFCTATSHAMPPYPTDFSWTSYADWTASALQQTPIVNVTWDDAQAYATWAGAQLTTEAQYEYAVRGPLGNNYPWGGTASASDPNNGWDSTKCANNDNSAAVNKGTWPVGSFPAGVSWCGAQDLAGNVWEWCADWESNYSITPVTNPTGPATGSFYVMRGGSWYVFGNSARGAHRACEIPHYFCTDIGFRCSFLLPSP